MTDGTFQGSRNKPPVYDLKITLTGGESSCPKSKKQLANMFSWVCEYIFSNNKTMSKLVDIITIGKVAIANDLLHRRYSRI